MNVLVTGANGQTGVIVVRKLLERRGEYNVKGLVRSQEGADYVRSKLGPNVAVTVCDVTQPKNLAAAFQGVQSVIILTSAVPQLKLSSLPGAIFKKAIGNKEAMPEFSFVPGGEPEKVDWLGQKNQIDAAKAAGVKHVILVSSMGGTDPNHLMNRIANANMIQWKRKAERYLMASGMSYTIIHLPRLLPLPPKKTHVPGGERQLLVGVDDSLMTSPDNTIPREDVAEVCIQALKTPEALNRSFDLSARDVGKGKPWDRNLTTLLGTLNGTNCSYKDAEWPRGG